MKRPSQKGRFFICSELAGKKNATFNGGILIFGIVWNYSRSARNFSASIAAIQPEPAEVTA